LIEIYVIITIGNFLILSHKSIPNGHLEAILKERTSHRKVVWGALYHDGVLVGCKLLGDA
jgi:hypothetical protein